MMLVQSPQAAPGRSASAAEVILAVMAWAAKRGADSRFLARRGAVVPLKLGGRPRQDRLRTAVETVATLVVTGISPLLFRLLSVRGTIIACGLAWGRQRRLWLRAAWAAARSPWLETVEDHVDEGLDVTVGELDLAIRHEQPVVERAVERVEYDVGLEALAQLTRADGAADDLAGPLPPRHEPALGHGLAQVLVDLGPADERPQDLPVAPAKGL